MAKDLHANGKVFEAIELFQELYFANPDTRNSLNLGFFVSTIGKSDRTDTILREALKNDPTNTSIPLVWGEVLIAEHRAPEVLRVLGMGLGKDHLYKHGLSPLVVKSLMEMGRWDEMGATLQAIKEQPLEDGLGNILPMTGEVPDVLLPWKPSIIQH